MSKFTEEFNRMQVNWFHRHLMNEQDKTMSKVQRMKGAEKVLTNEQHDELGKLTSFNEELSRFVMILSDVRANSDKHKHALLQQRELVQEAMELAETVTVSEAAQAELVLLDEQLAQADKIKLTLDRPVIKFIYKLIERDLEKFRTQIIPKYEKSTPDDYVDNPIFMQKAYWVAKSHKAKETLEDFKKKLEKGL